jgi:hypothetical protein
MPVELELNYLLRPRSARRVTSHMLVLDITPCETFRELGSCGNPVPILDSHEEQGMRSGVGVRTEM